MSAGVGVALRIGDDGMVVREMSAKGTAAASGMIHIGDVITKVDKTAVEGMAASEVEAMLRGPKGSTVRLKYLRGQQELTVMLEREIGNEHVLQQHHTLGGKPDYAPGYLEALKHKKQAEGMYHGMEKVNRMHHVEEEAKMTPEELAAYKKQRYEEDQENIRQSEELYERLKEHDEKVEKYGEKKAGQMERNERTNQALGAWHVPGVGANKQEEQPPPKDEGKQRGGGWSAHLPGFMHKTEPKKDKENKGWFDFGGGGGASSPSDAKIKLMKAAAEYKVSEMDRKMRKAVNKDNKVNRSNCFDFGQDKRAKEREKYPGEHAWPWEQRGAHDDQWLDQDVPTPFDAWFGGNKKKQHSN